jgi:hypothetical protein
MSSVELPGRTGETADPSTEPSTDDVEDASGGDSILSRLLSTHEPNTTPAALEADYQIPKGVAFMLYGTLQMTETGGVPAIGNVLLGAYIQAQEADLGGDVDQEDAGDADDVDQEGGDRPGVRTA